MDANTVNNIESTQIINSEANMNTNFTVTRGENKVEVIFKDGAPFQSVNGWAVKGYLNAITHKLAGTYKTCEAFGLISRFTLDELSMRIHEDDAGYVFSGPRMDELINAGVIARNLPTEPNSLYRLTWDSLQFLASKVPYVAYTEGEQDFVAHNRNAHYLMKALSWLTRFAEMAEGDNAQNLRLAVLPELANLVTFKFEEQYNQAPEAIKASLSQVAVNKQVYSTLKTIAAADVKPVVVEGTMIPLNNGTKIDAVMLVGQTVDLWSDGRETYNLGIEITKDNLATYVTLSQKRGIAFAIVPAAE